MLKISNKISLYCLIFIVSVVLGLGLRLTLWQWHEAYPLGGDEQEYFGQALTLLREHRYVELRLMRPPFYGLFLAGCIILVDSLVQNLRLIQVGISTLTIFPMIFLSREIMQGRKLGKSYLPLLAGIFCALNYTLAAHATELLTETLFLWGLTWFWYLILRLKRIEKGRKAQLLSVGIGLILGLLCLIRSIALPLIPLSVVWLLWPSAPSSLPSQKDQPLLRVILILFSTFSIILPWTTRNFMTYQALILLDTTGAENLWLDNDPRGREVVKRELYALGEDRAMRQKVAFQQGLRSIIHYPTVFLTKAWAETRQFFALEYTDDLRDRPTIWAPPLEVGMRLIFGDLLWLLLIVLGTYSLGRELCASLSNLSNFSRYLPHWFLGLWGSYIFLTSILFHVEMRYRLPLYPLLIPYAALTFNARPKFPPKGWAILLPLLTLPLTFTHAPYPLLAWQLGWKHYYLAEGKAALKRGELFLAEKAAKQALLKDSKSALAYVLLAQTFMQKGEREAAEKMLREALKVKPAHPYAHLLLGDLLRQKGDFQAAQKEFRAETSSLEDLQTWSWEEFSSPWPQKVLLGAGLDLGFIKGFHLSTEGIPYRWTKGAALIRLKVAGAQTKLLQLQLASGRPVSAPKPLLEVEIEGKKVGSFPVAVEWRTYHLLLPKEVESKTVLSLQSTTFTPRTYDPTSSDGRRLGIKVGKVEILAALADKK